MKTRDGLVLACMIFGVAVSGMSHADQGAPGYYDANYPEILEADASVVASNRAAVLKSLSDKFSKKQKEFRALSRGTPNTARDLHDELTITHSANTDNHYELSTIHTPTSDHHDYDSEMHYSASGVHYPTSGEHQSNSTTHDGVSNTHFPTSKKHTSESVLNKHNADTSWTF